MDLRQQLRELIAELAELDDIERITDDADLFRDLGLDSMNALEIVLEMEKRFGVELPEQALGEIRTLADAVRLAAGALTA